MFLSPPWGGPGYKQRTFDVRDDVGGLGLGMRQLLEAAAAMLVPSAGPLQALTPICMTTASCVYAHSKGLGLEPAATARTFSSH